MKISDFVAATAGGLSRTNRFSVVLTPPQTVSIEGMMPLQDMMLYCDQVQLPGLSLNTAATRTYGETREAPYEMNYEPISISFYVDTQLQIKSFFDNWIQSVQNGDRRTFNYYNEYICPQMQIYVEDLSDAKQYVVQLYEVYPKSVGAIQMDYSSKDIMKVTVNLQYKYWRNSSGTVSVTQSLSPGESIYTPNVSLPGINLPQIPQVKIPQIKPPQINREQIKTAVLKDIGYTDAMGNIAYNF